MDNAFHSLINFVVRQVTGSINESTHLWIGLASMELIHPQVVCIRGYFVEFFFSM